MQEMGMMNIQIPAPFPIRVVMNENYSDISCRPCRWKRRLWNDNNEVTVTFKATVTFAIHCYKWADD